MNNSGTNTERIFIALGGNLGDRESYLRAGLQEIQSSAQLVACSDFLDTAPVGGEAGQSDYLNAVAEIRCKLCPLELLDSLLRIEIKLGRIRGGAETRWGPRVIDLDLLLYGERIIEQPPQFILPHPRMHLRSFVLQPLCEIAPEIVHPVLKCTAGQLLHQLSG